MHQIKQAVLLVLLIFFALSAEAQRCRLTIQNNDSLPYRLFIGGIQEGEQFFCTQQFDSLRCGTCLLDLIMQDSLTTHIRTDLDLDTTWVPELILSRDSLGTYLRLENKDDQPMSRYLSPGATSEAGISMEIWRMDNMPCAPPATPAQMHAWTQELNEKEFERDKLRLLRQLFSGEPCLTTEQIAKLIVFLDDEEKRLEMLRAAHAHCYDKHNFHQLESLLYLSKSHESFESILIKE